MNFADMVELIELEQRWLDLRDGYDKAEISDHDFFHHARALEEDVRQLKLHNDEAAEELLYRIEMKKCATASEEGIAFCADNLERLWAQHRSDPYRFPAHPEPAQDGGDVEDQPSAFDILARTVAINAALVPTVGRATIKRLTLFADKFITAEESQMLRIHVAQALDNPRPLLEFLKDNPLPAPAAEMGDGDWLAAHDHAAMALLQVGDKENLNLVIQAMLDSGRQTLNQPVAMVAESLCPLAHTVDQEVSVTRARYVLTHALGNDSTVGFILKVAEFLIRGGLVDQGLSLIDQAGSQPEGRDCMYSLTRALRAAKEQGRGEFELPRFTSPKWQERLEAYALTVDELHAAVDKLAREDARLLDARNETDYNTVSLDEHFTVPALRVGWFEGTVVETLGDNVGQLKHLPVGEKVDQRLDIFLDGFGEEPDETAPERMDKAGGLPEDDAFVKAMEAFYEVSQDDLVRNEMTGEKILELYDQLKGEGNQLATDILGLYMLQQYASMPYPVLLEGLKYLPLMAHLRPERAIEVGLYMYMNFRYRLHAQPAALEALLFVSSLIADGHRTGGDLVQVALGFSGLGRPIDALAVCAAATDSLRNNSGAHEDPLADRAAVHEISGNAYATAGAFVDAGLEHATVAQLWMDNGNHADAVYAASEAANNFMECNQPADASRCLRMVEPVATGIPSRCALFRAAHLRLVCYIAADQQEEAWEKYFTAFTEVMEIWLGDFDMETAGDYEDLVNRLGHTSAKLRAAGMLDKATAMMGWIFKKSTGLPHPAMRFKLMDDYAVALIYGEKHDQAALIFESLAQQAQRAGDEYWHGNAIERLTLGADYGWHPAYADALSALHK